MYEIKNNRIQKVNCHVSRTEYPTDSGTEMNVTVYYPERKFIRNFTFGDGKIL